MRPSTYEKITAISRREWADPQSLTSRNAQSLPADTRQRAFILLADLGGVCVLYPSGQIRVFDHQRQERPIPMAFRAIARKRLTALHPDLADELSMEFGAT